MPAGPWQPRTGERVVGLGINNAKKQNDSYDIDRINICYYDKYDNPAKPCCSVKRVIEEFDKYGNCLRQSVTLKEDGF
jgi:hypothetical protein